MSSRRNRDTRSSSSKPTRPGASRLSKSDPKILGLPRLMAGGLAALAFVIVVAIAGFVVLSGNSGAGTNASPSPVQVAGAHGGHWTNVTPDELASMLERKDFTLLNVKMPYIGEISGTDQYIPYDQITARKSELPANITAKILVYCRSGVESAQAAQTLLNLGFTNVWNLDGGMNAWQQSGRTLVNLNR